MNWLDFWLGVGLLAIIPFVLAAYGGHVAAETISDVRQRRRVKLTFWVMSLIGVGIAVVYQFRITKSDDEKQKVAQQWQEGITTKLDKIIENPESKEQQRAAVELKGEVARMPNVFSFPIIVEFHVSNSRGPKEKFITIKNPGRVGIADIQIEGIRYVFDRDAWISKTLKLDFFSQLGILATIPPVGPGKSSKPLDMGKFTFVKLYRFADTLDIPEKDPEPFRTFYCLRFTFRDQRTKQRYAFYKVTSAFYGSPTMIEEEGTSAGGGVGHLYLQDVPEVVKAAAREFYGTAIKEYQP